MHEKEKQRSVHLMILIYNTIFIVALIVGAIYLKLETWVAILFFIGLVTSWVMHIAEKAPETVRLWVYIILSMLAFSYYGIYEMGLFDLTSAAMVLILICITTEERNFIRLCTITYYLAMCYKMAITYENILNLPPETVIRIFYHFILVFCGERLAEMILQRRQSERGKTDETIAHLEEANQRAEDFLANVSHELRTPINAVTGITALMLKNEEDPQRKKELLPIQMAGNRLFNQIEDILDYTETDSGRLIVSEEKYMISSMISDLIIGNRPVQKEKNLEIIFDIDARIPKVLLGDGRKIKKIIKHLIDNAVKFTEKGGIYIRVFALNKPYGINLCIKVCDTGEGIAEEELGKITEKFFQSNGGRNRRKGGLGLGLSIVYGMVTAMDGFIQIESTEGSGTTVSVSIPQKVADPAPAMEVVNPSELCIACYFRPEKYEVPEIRDYYNALISHMVQELDLTIHRVFALEELKKLVAAYQLTHLIIAREEYEEESSYFEALDKDTEVIVVSNERFVPKKQSRVRLVTKPLFCLPIVNLLNSKAASEFGGMEQENMICPGVRVLVVDDEPMNLIVAEGIFKAYQMEVTTAGSGMEAIRLCENKEFDLVFLDHMMPGMDGVETLKRLRKIKTESEKALTCIAFTANAVSGAREMFLQEGFDEFISKPVEEQELRQLLRKVLPKSAIAYVDEDFLRKKESLDGGAKESSVEEKEGEEEEEVGTEYGEYLAYGISIEKGLSLVKNDPRVYLDIIKVFLKERVKQDLMRQMIEEQNMKDYAIYVHGLKGNARTLGADRLADAAYEHEMKSKAGDLEYVQAHWNELVAVWDNTLDGFGKFYGVYRADEVEKYGMVNGNGGEVRELSQDDIAEVIALLDNFEREKAVEKLKEWISSPLEQGMHERIKEVLVALEDEFDEDKAIALLKQSGGN